MKKCCFIGHREVKDSETVYSYLVGTIKDLIEKNNVFEFLFGSIGEFNALCHKAVTELKLLYPEIKRIYVRAEYPQISDSYKKYLLESYEDTFFPEELTNATRAVYVKRNYFMIENSDYAVFYYDIEHCKDKKSGTRTAYSYALKKKIQVINIKA